MSMTFEQMLNQDGKLVYKTRGISMQPMLYQNRDLVVIEVPKKRLQKYDVALYKRGDSYILHRVIEVLEDRYDIRGDNTFMIEKVPDRDVIGVLTAFVRKGKHYKTTDLSYRIYARVWCAFFPMRDLLRRFKVVPFKIARALGITPFIKKILKYNKNNR